MDETQPQPATLSITIEGKTYTVRPLRLGTIEDIAAETIANAPNLEDLLAVTQRGYSRARAVLALALKEDHPTMTAELLRELRINSDELFDLYRKIMIFSGLRKKEPAPGEAGPGAASTGAGSTAT